MPDSCADRQGVIRYDWSSIKLLYVGGASHSDIAHGLTIDCPEHFDRARAAIAQASSRDDWPSLRELSNTLVQSRVNAHKSNDSTLNRVESHLVTQTAASTYAARKNRYLDVTSRFIDRASDQLEKREIESLEQAALAAKLMQPVHEIARDIHGLNAKEGAGQVQVNILSDWAGGIPPSLDVQTQDTTSVSSSEST